MPFKSQAQSRAAFGGYLGPEMQAKAPQWAAETPSVKSLPQKVNGKKPTLHPSASRKAMLGAMTGRRG